MRNYQTTGIRLFLLVGLIFGIIQIVQAHPEANFQIQGNEWVKSNNDSLLSGIHRVQYTYGVSVFNLDDDSDTVLGNITYTLDADNIVSIDNRDYAQRNGSVVRWVFPRDRVLVENDWIFVGAKSGYYYPRYVPININRWTNKSVFDSDGFQLATFNATFEDLNSTYDGIWGGIQAKRHTLANATLNASILVDTFNTDAPISRFSKITAHEIHFSINKSLVEANRTYNFSVIIKLNAKKDNSPTISAVEYKPYFAIALEKDLYRAGGTNFTATTPEDILPEHIRYASASTNVSNTWSYSTNFMRGMGLNEVIKVVNTTTPSGVSRYAGIDGIVQKDEAIQAVIDYFGGAITRQLAIEVIVRYFGGG